ncbi:DUF1761 domain-containing protein [Leptospira inadai]|nr:DUF1761 domain-containing protein [Leptospira inadai]PNV75591.1 DUF1761 domain-containing protein [Leptospira inadai serovar Lyme]
MKNYVLAVFSYLVPTFILGVIWHFVFFNELYESFGIYNRRDPIIPLGFGSMLIQGLILAYLYPFYYKDGENSIKRGIQFGLIAGVFLYSVSTIANAAKIQVNFMTEWFTVQAAFHIIQFVIAGSLIGLSYGEKVSNIAKS